MQLSFRPVHFDFLKGGWNSLFFSFFYGQELSFLKKVEDAYVGQVDLSTPIYLSTYPSLSIRS
jgi:hypothetical protein